MKMGKTMKKMILGVFMALPIMVLSFAADASAETAKDNYGLYCVQCHGTKGVGKGINAPFLAVAPRNHTSAKDMSALTDDGVFKAIKEGGLAVGKSNQMPPFRKLLADAEINDIVKHLRGMCKCEGAKK